MKFKPWNIEDAFTLLRALELRLSPIGYHVAMPHLVKPGEDLSLVVYAGGEAGEITKKDRDSIASLLQATEMRLLSVGDLEEARMFAGRVEAWTYGRGKNMRKVQLFF